MGLPQGDFAPVASNDGKLPASIAAYISQFGEHSVPALGTRFLLSDYSSQIKALVLAAKEVKDGTSVAAPITRLWLPVEQGDKRTRAIIASRLFDLLVNLEVQVPVDVLERAILSGTAPEVWDHLKPMFGESEERRDRFDFLFKSYPTAPQFAVGFTTPGASGVLTELDLRWEHPSAGHLNWAFRHKDVFTRLSDDWARMSATYALFFELSSSQSNRMAATGSQSQMACVNTRDSITVVKTHLALSAPEFSLVACFPASGVYLGPLPRRVVVTTPLSVDQRATEFVQMDWR